MKFWILMLLPLHNSCSVVAELMGISLRSPEIICPTFFYLALKKTVPDVTVRAWDTPGSPEIFFCSWLYVLSVFPGPWCHLFLHWPNHLFSCPLWAMMWTATAWVQDGDSSTGSEASLSAVLLPLLLVAGANPGTVLQLNCFWGLGYWMSAWC